MSSHSEKFGCVFQSNKDTSSDLLPSICFSNVDLKWYDLTGDIHPKFKDFNNFPISFGFTINNVNKSGEIEKFDGKFKLPLKLGEIGVPDIDYLSELPNSEKKYAQKVNIITGDDDPRVKVLERTQIAAMFLLMTPGHQFFRENNFLLYLSLLVMLDDFADDHTTDVAKMAHDVAYKQAAALLEPGLRTYKTGEKVAIPSKFNLMSTVDVSSFNLSLTAMHDIHKLYESFFELNKLIYDEVLKIGLEKADMQPFFKSLLESYEALTLQHSAEWKKCDSPSMKLAQVELCKITISSIMAGEAIALLKGIKLNESIRSSFLFKWFLNQASTHAGKANDLISYNKETIEENDCNNEVYILHVIDDWPLEKALRKVLNDANQAIDGLNDTAKLLLELHEDDEDLANYIQVVKEVICGHLQWMAYISRYHPNLVYDCYLEEEN